MKIKLKYLVAIWIACVAILIYCIKSDAYTRPVIRRSDLAWSSYHAYHCILYWVDDKVTFSNARIRATLKAATKNKAWAKKRVKKLKLNKVHVTKKKVARIYDYIIENYDYDSSQQWLEQAVKTHRANCSAYADLFYVLCKAAKIPVRYEIGWTQDDSGKGWHCWNRVKIKKKWYWVDCTWGLPPAKKLWKTHSRIIEEW